MSFWGLAHAVHALSHAFPTDNPAGHHVCSHAAHPVADDAAPTSPKDAHEEDAACAFCDTDLGPLSLELLPVALRAAPAAFPAVAAPCTAAPTQPQKPQPVRGPPARG